MSNGGEIYKKRRGTGELNLDESVIESVMIIVNWQSNLDLLVFTLCLILW